MFVFPLKLLPAILAVGGFLMILADEATAFSIILTIVGCIWSYYWYFKKE